jgi:hypothetical protein
LKKYHKFNEKWKDTREKMEEMRVESNFKKRKEMERKMNVKNRLM